MERGELTKTVRHMAPTFSNGNSSPPPSSSIAPSHLLLPHEMCLDLWLRKRFAHFSCHYAT